MPMTSDKMHCLICFKSLYEEVSLKNLLSLNVCICKECQNKFKKINNNKTSFYDIKVTFLYEYDDFMKELIYRYKGCYDIILKDSFLFEYKRKIKFKYHNYILIYPPSSKSEDEKRGFNHMQEIASCLSKRNQNIFYKKIDYKQSDQIYANRSLIKNVIDIKKNIIINPNKKYLIIDDIFTSGSTFKCIVDLLIAKKVKKENIRGLFISRTNH